jgi:Fur family transcriptional regulator, stress-responsive regulator
LRTVYQTLTDLAAMGELVQLNLDSGSTRFDPNVNEHHHLVCDTCGDVRDVYVDAGKMRVRDLDGFAIGSTDIVFRGRCASCATGDDQPSHPPPNPTRQRKTS